MAHDKNVFLIKACHSDVSAAILQAACSRSFLAGAPSPGWGPTSRQQSMQCRDRGMALAKAIGKEFDDSGGPFIAESGVHRPPNTPKVCVRIYDIFKLSPPLLLLKLEYNM